MEAGRIAFSSRSPRWRLREVVLPEASRPVDGQMGGTFRMDEIKQMVLIVDDSPENITVLGALFRSEYGIRVATSGEKALRMLDSDDFENLPDLILLDVVMTGLDGYEVCRRLKADARTKNIPVIFITGQTSEDDEVRGFTAGAVDYVTKPFSPVVILARVRTHMELKRYRDALVNASYQDGLTGIANRRRFNEYHDLCWNMAVRKNEPLSLIMLDIDDFKKFNDTYGHQEGDACLIRVARCLSGSLKRKTDLAARFGGEEFACILPNVGADGAALVAETILRNVRSLRIPHAASSARNCVTVSIGVATVVPNTNLAAETVIAAADKGLYHAKGDGKDRICHMEV